MKLLTCLTALMLMASPLAAADFDKGALAYQRGDYATALPWLSLGGLRVRPDTGLRLRPPMKRAGMCKCH